MAIIRTVDHNRHEGAALQRRVGNALTMSGQHAYHKRPAALVSNSSGKLLRERSLAWILANIETPEQVRKGEV
jgi:hypothetical protein